MVDGGYAASVKETFETKPLRTVLMIDDEFPSFSDVVRGEDGSKKFIQRDRALALYEGFRHRQMICDIENDVADVHADRFRKSDLIVLDYNLGPTDNDNEQSIRVLRELASSKHFNTIVLYTADPSLDEVWLAIMASLSGDWNGLPGALEGDAQDHWERLSDSQLLPDADVEAVKAYAERREIRDIPIEILKAAQADLEELKVPKAATAKIIEAIIHLNLAARAGKWSGAPRRRAVGKSADGVRWIQSHNSFVAIVQKADAGDDPADPYGIMENLGKALLAWRPNLIQVLVSEIQNILELEALATEDEQLGLGETQAGLWYYLLQNVGVLDLSVEQNLKAPLASLIDKLVDGIRRRLSTDKGLLKLASDAMLGELRDAQLTEANWPDVTKTALIKKAGELTRAEGKIDPKAVMFRLNSFLSTERFRRLNVTTGTVFRNTEHLWVAASPACDMVARKPGVAQAWAHAIHPMTPVVAIRLHREDVINGALNEAAKGNHIFLEVDGVPTALKLINSVSQPSYEFFFIHDEGRVREDGDKTLFDGSRMVAEDDVERILVREQFQIIGQLRNVNAIRVLQSAGQHLSRVGLDFVSLPAG